MENKFGIVALVFGLIGILIGGVMGFLFISGLLITNIMILALIFGLLAISILLSIAIIFGIIGIVKDKSKGIAIIGLVLGIVGFIFITSFGAYFNI